MKGERCPIDSTFFPFSITGTQVATIEFVDSMLEAHINKDKTPPLDLSASSNIPYHLDDDDSFQEQLDLSDEEDYSDDNEQAPLTPPPKQLSTVVDLHRDEIDVQSSPKAGLEETLVLESNAKREERPFQAFGPQLSTWLNATKAKQDGLEPSKGSSGTMGVQRVVDDSKAKERSVKKRKSIKTEEKESEPSHTVSTTESSSTPTSSKKKIRPSTETTLRVEAQIRVWAETFKTNPSFLNTLPRRSALTVRQYIESEQAFIQVLGEDYQEPNSKETNHKRRGRMRSDARWKEHLRTKKSTE